MFSQFIINNYGAKNILNMGASNLQSLLLEPIFYSDVCLLKNFHDKYFHTNMAWMMEADDLTGVCGFQSHKNTAFRYYYMTKQLEDAMTGPCN